MSKRTLTASDASRPPKSGPAKKGKVDEFRLILIGNTGSGKSSTGNTILRREVFEESARAGKGTDQPKTEYSDFNGIRLIVTDTPGLHSIGDTEEEIRKQVINFTGQMSPGPHAIVIVFSAGQKISKEIRRSVDLFKKWFGKKSTSYMIVVFTKIDQLKRGSARSQSLIPLKEYVSDLISKDEKMKELLEQCGQRCVGFNNTLGADSDENMRQVSLFVTTLRKMVKRNGGRYYTNSYLQYVETLMAALDEITGSRARSCAMLAFALGVAGVGVTAGFTYGSALAVETARQLITGMAPIIENVVTSFGVATVPATGTSFTITTFVTTTISRLQSYLP